MWLEYCYDNLKTASVTMYFYINLISYLGANILWDTAPRDI